MKRTMKAGMGVLVFLVLGFTVLMPQLSEADCQDAEIHCYCNNTEHDRGNMLGVVYMGACWKSGLCDPMYCDGFRTGDMEKLCNERLIKCKACPTERCESAYYRLFRIW